MKQIAFFIALSIAIPGLAFSCPAIEGDFEGYCGEYKKFNISLNKSCDEFKVDGKTFFIGKTVTKKSKISRKKKAINVYSAQIVNLNESLSVKTELESTIYTKIDDGIILTSNFKTESSYSIIDEQTIRFQNPFNDCLLNRVIK